jgi:hypothetical protein
LIRNAAFLSLALEFGRLKTIHRAFHEFSIFISGKFFPSFEAQAAFSAALHDR